MISARPVSHRAAARPPRGAHIRVEPALADVLVRESRGYLRAILAARTGRRGAVHELRIASRRLVAAVELAQAVEPAEIGRAHV